MRDSATERFHPPFRNKLLQALPPEAVGRLCLRHVTLEVKHEIEFPGNTIDNILFIEDGIGSMTASFKDGSQVEVCVFGFESAMGISALMGTRRSLNRVYMQMEGRGYASAVADARREFERHSEFHDLALRYVQAQLVQVAQSAGCNAKHGIEQRMARWMLLCSDQARTDTLPMSHEFLADMLGSARPTVSIAAGMLKKKGLIDYHRGMIRVLDREGLEQVACECYRVVKDHLDNYLEFDRGFVV